MKDVFTINHSALTLTHWQAVVTFGSDAVETVLKQPRWLSKYATLIQQTQSNDKRTKYDAILPGEFIYEMSGQKTCWDNYYADSDNSRLYAVARERKWAEPSSAESDGLVKLVNQQALLDYGAFCLFMASDKSIGYRYEKDMLRFANEPDNLSAKTKLLWTFDERGVNFIEESKRWDSMRGIITHANISRQAYFGGEAWRTGENELTINGASRYFGYNRDFPVALIEEAEKRYKAAISRLQAQNLKVIARPLGTR